MNSPAPQGRIFPDVKRVLVYRLGSLGDTLVALPSLHLIASAFPNAKRILLTNKPAHSKAPAAFEMIGGIGLIRDYIEYPLGTRNLWQLLKVWWKVFRFRPEWVIYLADYRGESALRRDERFFRSCGSSKIIGHDSDAVTNALYFPDEGLWERRSHRLLRRLEYLGKPSCQDLSYWDLRLTKAEIERATEVIAPFSSRPFLACGPGTKMQAKDWGQENWRDLIGRLSVHYPECGLALVGAKEDAEVSRYVASAWKGPVVNLCGSLTPRETGAVLSQARCFLGPDSGPMHLAASFGVPCVIAFASRTLPGDWFPFGNRHRVIFHELECSNCGLTTCIEKKKQCLTTIKVEEMLQATLEVWNESERSEEQNLQNGGSK